MALFRNPCNPCNPPAQLNSRSDSAAHLTGVSKSIPSKSGHPGVMPNPSGNAPNHKENQSCPELAEGHERNWDDKPVFVQFPPIEQGLSSQLSFKSV